jgi:hypothetical protein
MDSKQLEAETIKPVPEGDEEVAEGKLEQFQSDKEDENKDEEFSYESHRSPFPEGEIKILSIRVDEWANSDYS